MKTPPAYVLFGIPFHDVTFDEAVTWAVDRMRTGAPGYIATANVDFLMQAWSDPELQRILLEADLVLADGMPIVWASRWFGPRLRERVTGSDLVPLIAEACARERLRLFLLGGAPGVAESAAQALKSRHPALVVAGVFSPPRAEVLEFDHEGILARIGQAEPHLLLVAFGAPKQEKFINLHVRTWRVPLAIGVGGTLDFLAGVQPRAPVAFQRMGLEWVWRMVSDPRRLLKRYTDNLRFFLREARRLRRQRRRARREVPPAAVPPHEAWRDLVVPFPAERSPEDLAAAIRAAPPAPLRLVDLAGRTWLDSRDLGMLVALAREQRAAGSCLGLWRPAPALEEHLRLCRLDRYLTVCPTHREAELLVAQRRALQVHGIIGTDSYGRLRLWLPLELTAANVAAWRDRVAAAWPPSPSADVLIEADGTRFMDSAGIGWLIAVRRRALDERRPFRVTGFTDPVRKVLRLARVEAHFPGI